MKTGPKPKHRDNCPQFEECGRVVAAGGYCLIHYKRKHRGSLELNKRPPMLLKDALYWHGWNVSNSGCWEWGGNLSKKGYGRFKFLNKTLPAHKVSFLVHKGDIPGGLLVCHSCDNPKCVNPDHLWLGTDGDNTRDMARKGRGGKARGNRSGKSKITEEQALEIWNLKGKETGRDIARRYQISTSIVSSIFTGRCWGWITGADSSGWRARKSGRIDVGPTLRGRVSERKRNGDR